MIAENLAAVRAQISQACDRAHRTPHSITLVAVCKTHSVSLIREAIAAGVTELGENRAEEAVPKIETLTAEGHAGLRWHMIGHVQSRKAKLVVPHFALVHSVDSLRLAQKFASLAQEHGTRLEVLVQMNVSGELSKEGIAAHNWQHNHDTRAAVLEVMQHIVALPGVQVRGLMTIAPFTDEESVVRPVFASLRGLRDVLQQELGVVLPELSMGMTDDFPIAIEEGATIVRIGRAIFGERTSATQMPQNP